MIPLRFVCAVAMALVSFATANFAADHVCVTTAAGREHCGTISLWSSETLTIDEGVLRALAVADIAEIRFPDARVRSTAADGVVLTNGDHLSLSPSRCAGDQLTAVWPHASRRPALTWPLENVAALLFAVPPAAAVRRDWLSALNHQPAGHDVARLVAGDDLAGEFQSLSTGQINWKADFGPVKLDRQRVRWIRFDPALTATPTTPPVSWTVFLTDGSRFTATECLPQADLSVVFRLSTAGSVTTPRHEVVKLQRWTSRLQRVSQRTPLATAFTPYLKGERSLHVDRNALDTPLIVRGEEYATGLGVQSRAVVTYPVEAHDDHFQAIAGIDDAANGAGSAHFRIRVDDREIWSSGELTGRMPAVRVPPIPLQNAKTLSLIVDFGEYGDSADYADWCDAVIVRRVDAPRSK